MGPGVTSTVSAMGTCWRVHPSQARWQSGPTPPHAPHVPRRGWRGSPLTCPEREPSVHGAIDEGSSMSHPRASPHARSGHKHPSRGLRPCRQLQNHLHNYCKRALRYTKPTVSPRLSIWETALVSLPPRSRVRSWSESECRHSLLSKLWLNRVPGVTVLLGFRPSIYVSPQP